VPFAARVSLALALAGACLGGRAAARERAARGRDKSMPLRAVISDGGVRIANCVFSTAQIPENAFSATRTRDQFRPGDEIWGRCYLPDKPGPSRARELVDAVTIDGQPAWEQAYDQALPAAAESRLVPYGEVLRTLLAGLKPGPHRVQIVGRLKRGAKQIPLYRGSFAYVR
jgi:hypothetical protein